MIKNLSKTEYRAIFHILLLTLYASCVLIYEYQVSSSNDYQALDKQKHFIGGNLIFTGSYFVFLLGMSWFILSFNKIMLVKRLIWIPMSMIIILLFSFIVVVIIAFLKEGIDSTGVGNVEWADITATLDGAYAPNIRSVLIMVGLTPSLIPIDILLQFFAGTKVTEDISDSEISDYMENVNELSSNPDVLLIEDDLECSSVVLKFCKKLKLKCRHVETVSEARAILEKHDDSIKLILSDIFVRVEGEDKRETGLDFVQEVQKKYPKGSRRFIVILTTGFSEAAQGNDDADYILQKPWNAIELKNILQKHKVI